MGELFVNIKKLALINIYPRLQMNVVTKKN